MMSYQAKVLEEMERVATRHRVGTVVSYDYANTGELIAGTPFNIMARANFDFQPSRTIIRFNGAPLGPTNMSFMWAHAETDDANAMLEQWNRLIAAGLAARDVETQRAATG